MSRGGTYDALTDSELARERAWSRIYLAPLLLAEADRDAYRRDRASELREKKLMKDVPGWEVCIYTLRMERGTDSVPRPVARWCLAAGTYRLERAYTTPSATRPVALSLCRRRNAFRGSVTDVGSGGHTAGFAVAHALWRSMGLDDRSHDEDALSTTSSDTHEPAFHEEHMQASVRDMTVRDSISAMAVSRSHVALGMQSGMMYIVSLEGHLEKGFRFHTAPILDLVFDATGEFVASAGMDGIAAIASLTTSEQYQFDARRPLRVIRLEPHFASRSSRAFVCGGMSGVLTYREKRWFGHRDVVLHSDEGPIWALAWRGRWLAWANDRGVRVAHAQTHEMITLMPTPDDAPRPELARCTLAWRDASTLVVAHGDRITIARICEASDSHYVEVTDILQLDCLVAGMACTPQSMFILACVEYDDGVAPELRCVSWQGEELSSDALDMQRSRCMNDWHMCMAQEVRYDPLRQHDMRRPVLYVASPRQLSVLRPRDERDHIAWLLARRAYRQALEALEALGSAPAAALGYDVAAIGREYLWYLMEERGAYAEAAALMPLLLRTDRGAWDTFVCCYLERHQVDAILPHIPTQDPQLSEMVYDLVLVHLLQHDPTQLLATLRAWPSHIYSKQAVAAAIGDHARNSRTLLECLAQLYMAAHQPGKALTYYMRLRDPCVFDLIREYDLLIDVQHHIGTLVELDQECAGSTEPRSSALMPLLVPYTHSIPIQRAMAQLEPYPWYAYLYLDALYERDPSLVTHYAMDLLRLYCRFDYARLMPFLRTMSSAYSLKDAYDVCETYSYVPEMVFLRGRTGDVVGALQLILERLQHVDMALDFVRQQDDAELWDTLLAYSQDKPAYIRGLLEQASGEIDPVRIIRPIQDGLEIPGLRPSLIKIFHNFHAQHALLGVGLAVLQRDAYERLAEYDTACQAALVCDARTLCTVCLQPLLAAAVPIVLFLCRLHAAHLTCVTSASMPPLPPAVFAPVHETTTQQYRRTRSTTDLTRSPGRMAQERADRRAWLYARQARRLVRGCPACAEAQRDRLAD